MKENLTRIFWIIALISIGLPVITAFLNCNEENMTFVSKLASYASTSTTMLSGLCGLATLYIAILLYDRYGVEQNTTQKSIEAIDKLMAEMQNVNFVLCYYGSNKEGEDSDYIISLNFHSFKEEVIKIIDAEALSSTLYYKDSGMYGCVQIVERHWNSIYLPKSISKKLSGIRVFQYNQVTIPPDTRPVTTISAFSDKLNAIGDKLDVEKTCVPKTGYSVIQFLDAYFSIKEEIIKWYKKNGIDTASLNLTPTE